MKGKKVGNCKDEGYNIVGAVKSDSVDCRHNPGVDFSKAELASS